MPNLTVLSLPPVVSATELKAAGVDLRLAARRVRAGAWQRPARGVYVTHGAALSAHELAEAACLYAGPTAMLTGALALELRGLRWVPPSTNAHVLVPMNLRVASSRRIRVSRWTYDEKPVQYGELLLAPLARPVIDAGRGCSDLRDARGVLLAAVADGFVQVIEMQRVLALSQRNGSAVVRRALRDAERGCASPPEAELVDELVGRGTPFLVNPLVHWRGELLGSPDVLIVGRALAGEVDSNERHGSESDRTATYDRHERFARAGIDLSHLSVRSIRRDASKAADHLLARARAASPLPPDIVVVPRGPELR